MVERILVSKFLEGWEYLQFSGQRPQMSMTKIVGEIFNLKTEHLIF